VGVLKSRFQEFMMIPYRVLEVGETGNSARALDGRGVRARPEWAGRLLIN
jgi:hypothetical protein